MIQAAIDRGMTAAQQVEIDRARMRSAMEAIFCTTGLKGLDIIIAAERKRLGERFGARVNDQGFIA